MNARIPAGKKNRGRNPLHGYIHTYTPIAGWPRKTSWRRRGLDLPRCNLRRDFNDYFQCLAALFTLCLPPPYRSIPRRSVPLYYSPIVFSAAPRHSSPALLYFLKVERKMFARSVLSSRGGCASRAKMIPSATAAFLLHSNFPIFPQLNYESEKYTHPRLL